MHEQSQVELAVSIQIEGGVVMGFVFAAAFASEVGIGLENAEVHGAMPFGGRFLGGLEELEHAAGAEIDERKVIRAEAGEGGGDEVGGLRVFELGVEGDDGVEAQSRAGERGEVKAGFADDEQFVSEEMHLICGE